MDECEKRTVIHRKVESYLYSFSCSLWERLSICPKTIFTSGNKPGDTIQLNNAAAVFRRIFEQSFSDTPKLMTLASCIQVVLSSADSSIIDSRQENNAVAKALENAAQIIQ